MTATIEHQGWGQKSDEKMHGTAALGKPEPSSAKVEGYAVPPRIGDGLLPYQRAGNPTLDAQRRAAPEGLYAAISAFDDFEVLRAVTALLETRPTNALPFIAFLNQGWFGASK